MERDRRIERIARAVFVAIHSADGYDPDGILGGLGVFCGGKPHYFDPGWTAYIPAARSVLEIEVSDV